MNRAARYYTPRYQHAFPHRCLGFQRVDVTMADGRQLQSVVVLNAEWLELPAEFGDATVVDIRMASTTGR